jgi:hypothetical protein
VARTNKGLNGMPDGGPDRGPDGDRMGGQTDGGQTGCQTGQTECPIGAMSSATSFLNAMSPV